jgi:type I restriction enzyme S subunit
MGSEWPIVTLESVSTDVSYGYTESANTEKVGPHFLRITDIQNGVVDWRTVPFCPIDDRKKAQYLLEHGDIVIARTGNSTGENYIFTGVDETVFASYLIRFRIDSSKANPFFIWYTMRSPSWWGFVQSSKTGSAQAGANAKVLGSYALNLPPLQIQNQIAAILKSLDNKITLNRQLNQTLEQMAQALFKSWFVDFDPVIDNALAAGNVIPEDLQDRAERRQLQLAKADHKPLPENIRKLFPSEFELTESLGWVPKGWGEGSLLQSVELVGGGTPKTTVEEFWNGDIPWFSVVDAPNDSDIFVINTEKYVTQEGVDKSSTKILRAGTTIISARGTVGKCALVARPMAMNQSCYGVQGKENFPDEYVYFLIRCRVSDLQQRGHGSVFNTITKDTFESIIAPQPSPEVLEVFSKLVKPKFEKVLSNGHQIIELSQLRDTLLPKLISGELRIPEAQGLVEEVLG